MTHPINQMTLAVRALAYCASQIARTRGASWLSVLHLVEGTWFAGFCSLALTGCRHNGWSIAQHQLWFVTDMFFFETIYACINNVLRLHGPAISRAIMYDVCEKTLSEFQRAGWWRQWRRMGSKERKIKFEKICRRMSSDVIFTCFPKVYRLAFNSFVWTSRSESVRLAFGRRLREIANTFGSLYLFLVNVCICVCMFSCAVNSLHASV